MQTRQHAFASSGAACISLSIVTNGSATVNFDRSFRVLSKREDSWPCAPAQGRDGKEDEGCGEKEEGNGYMFHCICLTARKGCGGIFLASLLSKTGFLGRAGVGIWYN